MSRRIATEIEIEAPPAEVWRVFRDFSSWPDWNPFIISLEGEPEIGERLQVELRSPSGRQMRFRPRVLVWEPDRALIWKGRLLFQGLFDGKHRFEVESTGENHTRFIHAEEFSGLLVPLLWNSIEDDTRAGFKAMNEALKKRVEGRT